MLLAVSVLLFSLPILNQLLLGSPVDRRISFLINQSMIIVAGVLFLVCVVAVVGSVVALCFKGGRRTGVRVFLIGLVSMVSFFGGLLSSSFVRTKQFEDLAERTVPLIAAISRFEKEHGKRARPLSCYLGTQRALLDWYIELGCLLLFAN